MNRECFLLEEKEMSESVRRKQRTRDGNEGMSTRLTGALSWWMDSEGQLRVPRACCNHFE